MFARSVPVNHGKHFFFRIRTLKFAEQVTAMGPLIDAALEKVDRRHAQLTQLSSDLVDALNLYHTLMRDPPHPAPASYTLPKMPQAHVNVYPYPNQGQPAPVSNFRLILMHDDLFSSEKCDLRTQLFDSIYRLGITACFMHR